MVLFDPTDGSGVELCLRTPYDLLDPQTIKTPRVSLSALLICNL